MRLTIMSLLVLAATSAPHAQEPDNPPIVQVGVFKVVPDGSVRGYAVDTGERVNQSFATRVWVANGGCRMGAGDRDAPEGATDAWDVRGRVTNMSAEHATIQVEWARVRAAGAVIDAPRSTRQLTVPFNQLIPLDSAGNTDERCGPSSITFGARFAQRFLASGPAGGSSSGSASASAGGGSGGAIRTGAVPPYTAELWLVHSVPGKQDVVLPMTVEVVNGAAAFSFPLVRFSVPDGTFAVTMTGRLQLVPGPPGNPRPRMYSLGADRAVTFTPANRPARDPAEPHLEGKWSGIGGRLPGPDDVVAFEMPPLKVAGAPSVPDTFSIRLRLRPVVASN